MKRSLIVCWLLSCALGLSTHEPLYAQAGLRTSLEKLDKNKDGAISPDEITPLSRPYLERIARVRRLSLEKPNSIERLQDAARTYYSVRNGAYGRRDVRPEGESTVKRFGADRNQAVVPEFGLREVKYPYTQDDLDEAEQTMRRYDRNRDGFIDRYEARRSRWTHRDPFEMDLDRDDKLNRLELAQRYARRRLLRDDSEEFDQKSRREESTMRQPERSRESSSSSSWYRRGGNRSYVTSTVISRFDASGNGRLEPEEAAGLGVPFGQVDTDRDGEITRDELLAFLSSLDGAENDGTESLPSWFFELDANRDRQVAMAEFTEQWTDGKLEEFASLDLNGDGLLTAAEAIQSKAIVGGGYRNDTALVLPPRQTIISEIEIDEDFPIGDLNIQLSVTHTYVAHLDAYLTGPDGQRIELFTEVGGSGDHIDRLVLDDQARYPISKGRPPYRGPYLPEGLVNRQPGLGHYQGKSVKGVWQLILRNTRSDRFGMLHNWGLVVKPQDASGAPTVLSGFDSSEPPVAATYGRRTEGERQEERKATSDSESLNGEVAAAKQRAAAEFRELLQRMGNAKRQGQKPSSADWERYKALIERKRKAAADSGKNGDKKSFDKLEKKLEKSYEKSKSFEKKSYNKSSKDENRGDNRKERRD